MGPIALFDKSFIQMLSLDEAALFDKFYSGLICTVFYAEVLADLKKGEDLDEAKRAVARLCEKTPVMHSYPNTYHQTLLGFELSGRRLDLGGRPAVAKGKVTRLPNGKKAILYDGFPEAEAFSRWQEHRFLEVEQRFAAEWRASLKSAQLAEIAKLCRLAFSIKTKVRDLREAFNLARLTIEIPERAEENLFVGSEILGLHIPIAYRAAQILVAQGRPPLQKLFPYFCHCLAVELFFHICVEKTLISPDRPSNKIDITYLFYLPFCQIFVSNDKLHKACAGFFQSNRQAFVVGQTLKDDLKKIDQFYTARLDEINAQGLFRAVSAPPSEFPSQTRKLWKKFLRKEALEKKPFPVMNDADRAKQEALLNKLRMNIDAMKAGQPVSDDADVSDDDIEQTAISRTIPRSFGKYTIFPEDFE